MRWFTVDLEGDRYRVAVVSDRYSGNDRLALFLVNKHGEDFADITVNLPHEPCPPDCGYLDTNNSPWLESFVTDNGLGVPTGAMGFSGFCSYPQYRFDLDLIESLQEVSSRSIKGRMPKLFGRWKGRKPIASKNSKDGKPYRVIEAFSGIGAQSMALRTSDEPSVIGGPRRNYIPYTVVATSDIDPDANAAYEAINADTGWDPSRNVGDITHPGLVLPHCDILTYSFPCQALSKSGRLGGMRQGSGTTSSAVWSLLEQIRMTRPEWLIMENVPNIHSKRFMRDFQNWIDALSDLGYTSKWGDCNLTRFGLPQNRERTILLSHLGDFCPPVPLGSEGHVPLKQILEEDVDVGEYRISETVLAKLMYDGNPYGHRDFLRVINDTKLGYADAYEGDGVTLQHLTGKHRARGRVQKNRAPTLMTGGDSVGVVVRDKDGFLTVRRFTPREAYRLQGFPDWAIDRIIALGQSESAMYREAGNSLGVPMMREVFHTIDSADREKHRLN